MKNQAFSGTPTGHRFALCPTTILAGDPVFIGGLPAVALDNYSSVTGGTDFYFNGSFYLSVTAATALSPLTGTQISPGQNVYADGGTLDSTTNVKYGFTLDANSSTGTLFGILDPTQTKILTTVTNATAKVKIGG